MWDHVMQGDNYEAPVRLGMHDSALLEIICSTVNY
jgi:hypothetical protein